jgi:hypothetical protein
MPSLWRPTTLSTLHTEPIPSHQTPISSYETEEESDQEPTPNTTQSHSTVQKSPSPPPSQPQQSNLTKIKFIHATPKFLWKDMKEYGPFDPGEFIDIYPEVAELLVRKGRAVKA